LSAYLGLAALDLVYLGAGAAVLAGFGFARSPREFLHHGFFALFCGWATLTAAVSLAVSVGLNVGVLDIVAVAVVVSLLAIGLWRAVPRADAATSIRTVSPLRRSLALAGAAVLVFALVAAAWLL
jgi:hypothetical protein